MESGRIWRSGSNSDREDLPKIRFFLTSEISSFSSVYDAFTSHFVRYMARTGSGWSSLTPRPVMQTLQVSWGSNMFVMRAVWASNGSVDYRRDNFRRIRSRMLDICTNPVLYGPHMAPGRSLGVYRTMVGQFVLFRTLNGHVSGSHSSTPVSGIWTIITTHSTVSEGIVAFKDTSSHPIHGGK